MSLLELFDLLRELTEMPESMQFERLPRRQSDQDFFVADVTSAQDLLGWKPKIDASEGIRTMIKWTRDSAGEKL